jgi:4'-phosphopantetheinyl transferase
MTNVPALLTLYRQLHLYVGLLDEVDTPHARSLCMAMASAGESKRAAQFVHERHRRQFLLAHGLVRAALSKVVPEVAPAEWDFLADHYGRPYIVAPVGAGSLHFSLSHTEGCVACAISTCESVGVDVQATENFDAFLDIAEGSFSLNEIAALLRAPPQERQDLFFDLWTLKEAYIKARGMGLHLPLDGFSIMIGLGTSIGITFSPGFGDSADRWRFSRVLPSPRHKLAIADGSGLPGGLAVINQPWPLPSKSSREV